MLRPRSSPQTCGQLQRSLGEPGHLALFSINILVVLRVETALWDTPERKLASPSIQVPREPQGTGRAWPWLETVL